MCGCHCQKMCVCLVCVCTSIQKQHLLTTANLCSAAYYQRLGVAVYGTALPPLVAARSFTPGPMAKMRRPELPDGRCIPRLAMRRHETAWSCFAK